MEIATSPSSHVVGILEMTQTRHPGLPARLWRVQDRLILFILPNSFVKATGLKVGENVVVKSHAKLGLLQIHTQDSLAPDITPEFKKWVDDFIDRHGDALRELARR